MNKKYKLDWIIGEKLAVSKCPDYLIDQDQIIKLGIKNILCLCYLNEVKEPELLTKTLTFTRYPLPDHNSIEKLEINQLNEVIEILNKLIFDGPTLVHCLAGMERSPIVCISWLMKTKNISFIDAYEYVKGVHKETSLLNSHISLVKSYFY